MIKVVQIFGVHEVLGSVHTAHVLGKLVHCQQAMVHPTHIPALLRLQLASQTDVVLLVHEVLDPNQCFCFQNEIKCFLDTLSQKTFFLDNDNK